MTKSALVPPRSDPAEIFALFRGSYATELLVAAVAHFDLFGQLAPGPLSQAELREQLQLAERPMQVLATALRAMGLLIVDSGQRLALSALAAEHLVPGGPFDITDYLGLAATSPGVIAMVERLRSNRPAGAESGGDGTAYIYRAGTKSAMEQSDLARHFTLALSGRAANVAPVLAARLSLDGARQLVDVAGGTGLYSVALLQRHPRLRAIVFDRPEVLHVTHEFAVQYGVADRLECLPGDMFVDPLPAADVVLLSNVLHDWDVPECQQLIGRCAAVLLPRGKLVIHDIFLRDSLDGPLALALYSAALFTLTEGRAYSAAEYSGWLGAAGLQVTGPQRTLAHCGILVGEKPAIVATLVAGS